MTQTAKYSSTGIHTLERTGTYEFLGLYHSRFARPACSFVAAGIIIPGVVLDPRCLTCQGCGRYIYSTPQSHCGFGVAIHESRALPLLLGTSGLKPSHPDNSFTAPSCPFFAAQESGALLSLYCVLGLSSDGGGIIQSVQLR